MEFCGKHQSTRLSVDFDDFHVCRFKVEKQYLIKWTFFQILQMVVEVEWEGGVLSGAHGAVVYFCFDCIKRRYRDNTVYNDQLRL